MKRYILILASILVCWSASAQKPTKEEKKAQRMERRAEREREQHIKDSLYWAKIFEKQDASIEKRRRESVTDIIATVPLSADEALEYVAKTLIDSDYMITVDKEYKTISTAARGAGLGSYSLYFRFSDNTIKACAFGHFNSGVAFHGIVVTSNGAEKLKNVGNEGSLSRTAFTAYETILKNIPGATLQYIEGE